jgi:hypothetical protein
MAKNEVTVFAQRHEIAGCQLELRMQVIGHHMVYLERGDTITGFAFLLLLEVLAPYR